MLECGAKHQYQRVILSTGYLSPMSDGIVGVGTMTGHNPSGTPKIQWSRCNPEVSYKAFATIRRRIGMRGGTYLPLVSDDEIPAELRAIENDLRYLSGRDTKELMVLEGFPPDPPEADDPLQTPVEVKDGRRVIAAFKGIGPKKANSLYGTILEWNLVNKPLDAGFTVEEQIPTLNQMLVWGSMTERRWKTYELPKVPGWGDGMRKKLHDQLGLEDNQDLDIRETANESSSAK